MLIYVNNMKMKKKKNIEKQLRHLRHKIFYYFGPYIYKFLFPLFISSLFHSFYRLVNCHIIQTCFTHFSWSDMKNTFPMEATFGYVIFIVVLNVFRIAVFITWYSPENIVRVPSIPVQTMTKSHN